MLARFFTFSHITLYVALSISAIAAYYSVLGLAAIFAGAVIPIIVMGSILEIAKITTTIWLHRYWKQAGLALKSYLTTAVIVLACLTSMGIFGLLSKAHVDSGLQSGDVAAQVAILDEKIKTQRENIEAGRKTLLQLDAQVNERLSRGSSETGAERSVQIRRQQAAERTRLQREISDAQTAIAKLNEQRAPIASQLRAVEAEVGPVKYIAALIYGDNPDAALLERAVRWVTIMIVLVFDPLAIVLILASQNSFRWASEEQEKQLADDDVSAMNIRPPEDIPGVITRPFTQNEMDALDDLAKKINAEPIHKSIESESDSIVKSDIESSQAAEIKTKDSPNFSSNYYARNTYTLQIPSINTNYIDSKKPESESDTITQTTLKKRYCDDEEYVNYEGKQTSIVALKSIRPDLIVSREEMKKPIITFAPQFPREAFKDEYCIRIDTTPHTVYRFTLKNSNLYWALIDKNNTSVYLQNRDYVRYLVKKLENSEYDLEWLTAAEQEEISKLLSDQ